MHGAASKGICALEKLDPNFATVICAVKNPLGFIPLSLLLALVLTGRRA